MAAAGLWLSAVATLAACGLGGPNRAEVLSDLAVNGIGPTFEELDLVAGELAAANHDLCDDPDPAALRAAREALATTRWAWSTSEAMWVGPVMDRRSWALIDWPIRVDEIESLIADTTVELDDDRLANRIGADQRGLQAIEYLLGAGDDAAVVDSLGDRRRCVFLTGISDLVAAEADALAHTWTVGDDDGAPYIKTFSAGSTDLDSIVNDALFLLEAMTDAELGTALGEMDASADPAALVEGSAGLGSADLSAHLGGLRTVLVGDDRTAGLGPLLGDDLTRRLTTAFDESDAAVADLGSPLTDDLAARPEAVSSARDSIKEIQVLVATEVVSRLGVTIGFSDADGDTG